MKVSEVTEHPIDEVVQFSSSLPRRWANFEKLHFIQCCTRFWWMESTYAAVALWYGIHVLSNSNSNSDGVLSRISNSSIARKGKSAASDASYVAKRLWKSTGKAVWIVATTFIVLGLPLIIELEREAQLSEAEFQQSSLLGAPSAPPYFQGPPK